MWNFNLLTATRTVEAAMPFLLYRTAVCLGLAVASLIAALAGAGTFIAFASFSAKPGSVAGFGALLGLAAFVFLLKRFRGPLLFNIQAGHLALLAELANHGKLPQGKAQIDLAKQKAARIFPSSADFAELDDAVRQVLRSLPAKRCSVLGRIANPTFAEHLGHVAGWLAQTSGQALLSLCFLAETQNPWQAARAGLILHLRHFDSLSKNRFYLLGFEYIGLALAYLAVLYPLDSAIAMLPVDVGIWRYVFALIFAWSLKAAFLEPIATTALAELYFNLTKQDLVNGEVEAKALAGYSGAFQKITEKAGVRFGESCDG